MKKDYKMNMMLCKKVLVVSIRIIKLFYKMVSNKKNKVNFGKNLKEIFVK